MTEESNSGTPKDLVRLKKKQRITIHNKNDYRSFFNHELKLFLEYRLRPRDSDLRASYVSHEGSSPSTSMKVKMLGTKWTIVEKEIFFEFLGRYGIGQVERIQEKIQTKSVLEILQYYELLKNRTDWYKRRKSKFLKMIRYDQIPQAMEVDETWIKIEEELASSLDEKAPNDDVNNSERDSGDDLIDKKSLQSLSSFYQTTHLESSKPIIELGTIITDLTEITRSVLQSLISTMIKNHVCDLRSWKQFKSTDQGLLLIENINDSDILKAMNTVVPKRPMIMRKYMRYLHDRFDFKIINDENPKIMGRIRHKLPTNAGDLTRKYSYSQFWGRIEKKELENFMIENELLKEVDDEDIGWFVTDDPMSILDSKLALKIFYKETSEIEERDALESERYLSKLLTALRHLNWYKEARIALKKRAKQNGDVSEPNELDWSLKSVYREINQDEKLIETEPGSEITDEMMRLYSITLD